MFQSMAVYIYFRILFCMLYEEKIKKKAFFMLDLVLRQRSTSKINENYTNKLQMIYIYIYI